MAIPHPAPAWGHACSVAPTGLVVRGLRLPPGQGRGRRDSAQRAPALYPDPPTNPSPEEPVGMHVAPRTVPRKPRSLFSLAEPPHVRRGDAVALLHSVSKAYACSVYKSRCRVPRVAVRLGHQSLDAVT